MKCGKARTAAVVLNAPGSVQAEGSASAPQPPAQKWGTFETHAQRTAGISHEESMKRIDDFVHGGAQQAGATVQKAEASTKLTGQLQGMLARNGIKGDFVNSYTVETAGAEGGSGSGGGGRATVTTEVTETHYEVEGDRKEGLISQDAAAAKFNPNAGSNAGAAFLAQHQAKEAAKYKPGYANRNPNGVR